MIFRVPANIFSWAQTWNARAKPIDLYKALERDYMRECSATKLEEDILCRGGELEADQPIF